MAQNLEQLTLAINLEQEHLQEAQLERNRKFNKCLSSYLQHLEEETHKLEMTEEQNTARNAMISQAFENVYDRIVMGSQIGLRKVKHTCYEKMEFWNRLIQGNAHLKDLEFKRDLYVQKENAKEKYQQTLEYLKMKKIPYKVMAGKKEHRKSLRNFNEKNAIFDQEAIKGLATMESWKLVHQTNKQLQHAQGSTADFQIGTKPDSSRAWRPPLQVSRIDNQQYEKEFLMNFQKRRD